MNDVTDTNNCTRVTSIFYGALTAVTIRDYEIEKLEPYIAEERARGATVTTERGVWIE